MKHFLGVKGQGDAIHRSTNTLGRRVGVKVKACMVYTVDMFVSKGNKDFIKRFRLFLGHE